MITKQESRSIIRAAVKRVPEGEEIRHLNIMPMMDIMTILLVAFLVISAEASAAIEVNSVELPTAQSFDPPPELAEVLTISKEAILIGGEPFLPVLNGDVDQSKKKDGALGPDHSGAVPVPRLCPARGGESDHRRRQEAARAPGAGHHRRQGDAV